ncbi:Oxidoreductase-like domain-containing 1 [Schistosoma japonicum]|uniref:Oxidoreductase-like domain-containing 1 n=1 Tax=Schistosoma japonicum TaxID=6182 RepID=A0A4Z2CNQ8_SCHJA|nr:Oxidoreductase-like domain-containing 1 [Schistosoma japonicum]
MGFLRKLNLNQPTIFSISKWSGREWQRTYSSNTESEPEPPQRPYCCESGCANCVWIEYAENLLQYHIKKIDKESNNNVISKDKEEVLVEIVNKLREEINQIEDHSVRIFLLTEIAIKHEKLLKAVQNNI